jgi:hypothetical protein
MRQPTEKMAKIVEYEGRLVALHESEARRNQIDDEQVDGYLRLEIRVHVIPCGSGRGLAGTVRGRPFVLLGVNSDDDMVRLKEQMKREHITIRSWNDGGGGANTPGPIARRFNVHSWPSLCLLDAHGIIRHKFFGTPSNQRLVSAISAVVQTAEKESGTPKK